MIAKAKSSLTPAPNLEDLPGKVEVVNRDEVLAYLAQHPELVPILPDLCARTRAEFGDEAELLLELKHDFEIYDPHLVLCVRMPQYGESVREKIHAIDMAFDDRLADNEGWLWVTTDYRTTRGKNAV